MTDVSLLQEQTTQPCGGDKHSLSQTRLERCDSGRVIGRQCVGIQKPPHTCSPKKTCSRETLGGGVNCRNKRV